MDGADFFLAMLDWMLKNPRKTLVIIIVLVLIGLFRSFNHLKSTIFKISCGYEL